MFDVVQVFSLFILLHLFVWGCCRVLGFCWGISKQIFIWCRAFFCFISPFACKWCRRLTIIFFLSVIWLNNLIAHQSWTWIVFELLIKLIISIQNTCTTLISIQKSSFFCICSGSNLLKWMIVIIICCLLLLLYFQWPFIYHKQVFWHHRDKSVIIFGFLWISCFRF